MYYMMAPKGEYYNYSGCGNTFNCNQPTVRQFILDCLRYWVTEYHVDGFRWGPAACWAVQCSFPLGSSWQHVAALKSLLPAWLCSLHSLYVPGTCRPVAPPCKRATAHIHCITCHLTHPHPHTITPAGLTWRPSSPAPPPPGTPVRWALTASRPPFSPAGPSWTTAA